jgi:hypothetical protein
MNSNYRELHYFTWNDLTKQLISKACLYIPQNIASTKTLRANISNLQDSHMNIYWRTVLKGETRENQFHSLVSASASHAIGFIILLRIAYQYSSFLSRQQASQCLSSSIRNSSLIELCCFWRLQNVFEHIPSLQNKHGSTVGVEIYVWRLEPNVFTTQLIALLSFCFPSYL